ncbi:ABC transporter permease [Rhodobaculum claviforme]|uniref:ABC transporter permease n=1 Tax=Rhodobaculum claviforme TaxID=1549854 RepID=A0A934WHM0_9RHOB|nr:ABC transporter permease [Rhodobaculum claviforme]MBK5925892.1 ABC transporter permease [Rhodobaculum claviforme]
MRALDRKLLRDLWRIRAQALAIALVLACGVAVLVLGTGTQSTLTETRDAWYERNRFADVFARATRAPRALLDAIAEIDGVAQVEARIARLVVLDMPALAEPAMGWVISVPDAGDPVLNQPLVRRGTLPDPHRDDAVAVSEPFAEAHGLRPGDGFDAVLNGTLRRLTVSGTVLSPEFIYTMGPGTMIPDDLRFGVLWMGQAALAAAFDMDGAFDDVALRLTPGAREAAVIAALDHLLAPYGGQGAHGRDRQLSHGFLDSELQQLGAIALILPPVFFVVTAFLVNMVLGRLIALERLQIGLLKAVGYSTGAVAAHYLKLALAIGGCGVAIGWLAGAWLAAGMAGLYADFFRFPYLVYRPEPVAFAVSGGLALATVVAGALRAVWRTVRLAPAVAMSPPAPPRYARGLADRVAAVVRLRQTSMMILRSVTRYPGRAAVTVFGVMAATAIMVASLFTFDAMDAMMEDFFYTANRAQVTLMLSEARGDGVLLEAARLPGVLRAEGHASVPIRLRHGPHDRTLRLEAQAADATLIRVLDRDGRVVPVPPRGIALPATLAQAWDIAPGDLVAVEFLVPPRETHLLPVTALTRQSMGQDAHMDADALSVLLRQAPQVNRIDLLIDTEALGDLHAAVKATPAVAGVMLWDDTRARFRSEIQANLWTMVAIYATLGTLVTVGVVYNAARIQLSERAHELASLRVLGFSRADVAWVLMGEVLLLTLLALPLGWVAGYGFAAATAAGLSTEFVSIPLVVTRATYGAATVVVGVAAVASVVLVRRQLDRVDMVSALKARE